MSQLQEKRDLFLSYHTPDRDSVQTVRQLLEDRGLSTFLDREHLTAGLPWPQALEDALQTTRAVAVFLGRDGLGLWMKREMGLALDRQVQEERAGRSFPVIPVLLPGADPTPSFLFLNTWVDLRQNLTNPEALEAIAKAIHGEAPIHTSDEAIPFCPYRGLRAFYEEHAAFFCGREAFIDQIFNMVLNRNLIAVIGPSGSGKSSVIHAGLLPRLRRQHHPHETWDTIVFTPGEQPFYRLAEGILPLLEPRLTERKQLKEARALGNDLTTGAVELDQVLQRVLLKSEGTDHLLLVGDQFEELFTLSPGEARKPFIEQLLQALDHSNVTLVLTLRGDFYGQAIGISRDLSDRLQGGIVNLGSMRQEELRRALTEPAQRVGLSFEKGLADLVLNDVGDQPGNLPLLEFALSELWTKRQGSLLTYAAYKEIGGVSGALSKRAEIEFNKFSPSQQDLAQRIFTRLVRVASPDEGGEDTRRRLALTDLDEDARPIVQALTDARMLVTFGNPSEREYSDNQTLSSPESTQTADVEVAHEALIRGWGRLQQWVNQDREFLLWIQRLRIARNEWQRTNQDKGTLLRGAPLIEAEHWLNERGDDLNDSERDFIHASVLLRQREQALARRHRGLIIAGLSLALILISIVAFFAIKERDTAISRELAASALGQISIDPQLSLLLAIEATKQSETQQAKDVLRLALRQSHIRSVFRGHQGETWAAEFSPDGKTLASISKDGTARIWDISSGRKISTLEHDETITGAIFSPNNQLLLTWSSNAIARVWDPTNGEIVTFLEGHSAPLTDAQFSPDGDLIVTTSQDKSARIWKTQSGERLLTLSGHADEVTSASFSPNGQFVVTSSLDNTANIWDSKTGEILYTLRGHSDDVGSAKFSHSGNLIVTASADKTAKIWNTKKGKLAAVLEGHLANVSSAAFSPDNQYVVTTSDDRTARIWAANSGRDLTILDGHSSRISDAAFSPDGHWIVTASFDGTARLWNRRTGKEMDILRGHTGRITSAAFSPDGEMLATTGRDRSVRLWAAPTSRVQTIVHGRTGPVFNISFSPNEEQFVTTISGKPPQIWDLSIRSPIQELIGHTETSISGTYSPNGNQIITSSFDGITRLWDAKTGENLGIFGAHEGVVYSAGFSPDGQKIVTASQDTTARIWDVNKKKELVTLSDHKGAVLNATFSPDGLSILTASEDRTARIWQAATGKQVRQLEGHTDWVHSANFSPDGRQIITASADKTARIWEVENGMSVKELRGHTGSIYTATYSPDGNVIVTASEDGTARVWEAGTGEMMDVIEGHAGSINSAIFTPDGKYVVTAGEDGAVHLQPYVTPSSVPELLNLAQNRINKSLTPEEQRQYLAGVRSY